MRTTTTRSVAIGAALIALMALGGCYDHYGRPGHDSDRHGHHDRGDRDHSDDGDHGHP